MREKLNREQKKHIAALFDKLSFAYFAAVGYVSYEASNYLLLLHAVVLFVIVQSIVVWLLGEGDKAP
jgi:hypothetical protein